MFGFDFFKQFACLVLLLFSGFCFKVNSGVFLHNRVATLLCCTPLMRSHNSSGVRIWKFCNRIGSTNFS